MSIRKTPDNIEPVEGERKSKRLKPNPYLIPTIPDYDNITTREIKAEIIRLGGKVPGGRPKKSELYELLTERYNSKYGEASGKKSAMEDVEVGETGDWQPEEGVVNETGDWIPGQPWQGHEIHIGTERNPNPDGFEIPSAPPMETSIAHQFTTFSDADLAAQSKYIEGLRKRAQAYAMMRNGAVKDNVMRTNNGETKVTQKMRNTANLFKTTREASLLLWGINKPPEGESISTVIMGGKGPKNNEGNMLLETEPGFTTLLVATGDANGDNPIHNTDMSNFGVFPQVFNTLMPQEDPSMYDVIEVKEGDRRHFCVQLPMSHLIRGTTESNRSINLLFFSNERDMEQLMTQGIFHHMEYYATALKSTISQRYNKQLRTLQRQGGPLTNFQKLRIGFSVFVEALAGIDGFTLASQVRAATPDILYLYHVFKFYFNEIQKLTNKLTILHTKLSNGERPDFFQRSIETSIEGVFNKLMNIIYEMDIWNYFVRTSFHLKGITEPEKTPGIHWFSALGIAVAPRPGTSEGARYESFEGTSVGDLVASYKLGTKPKSCYPRWMALTWAQVEIVETSGKIIPREENMAIDRAVDKFNDAGPSAYEQILFGNTQTVWSWVQRNRPAVAQMTVEEKAEKVKDTSAGQDKSVAQAQKISDDAHQTLQNHILLAHEMTDAEFFSITGRQKKYIVAQEDVAELQNRLDNMPRAFPNGAEVELPQKNINANLLKSIGRVKIPLPIAIGSDTLNQKGTIQSFEFNIAEFVVYTVRVGDKTIQIPEKILLTVQNNVDLANEVKTKPRADGKPYGLVVDELDVPYTLQTLKIEEDSREYEKYLENKHLLELASDPEQQQKADGITLMFALKNRADRLAEIKKREKAFKKYKRMQADKNYAALTGQQGQANNTPSSKEREEVYQKYELFKKKWKQLRRSWNILESIGAVTQDANGNKNPPAEWNQSMNTEEGTQEKYIQFNFLYRSLRAAMKIKPMTGEGVMKTILDRITNNFFTDVTLANIWNNGRLKTFSEWAETATLTTVDDGETKQEQNRELNNYYKGQGGQVWYEEYSKVKEDIERMIREEEFKRNETKTDTSEGKEINDVEMTESDPSAPASNQPSAPPAPSTAAANLQAPSAAATNLQAPSAAASKYSTSGGGRKRKRKTRKNKKKKKKKTRRKRKRRNKKSKKKKRKRRKKKTNKRRK